MRLLIGLACLVALAAPCAAAPRHVIVIVMENKDGDMTRGDASSYVYGNTAQAPYINGELWAKAARAANFVDNSDLRRSQPHYIEMVAGRATFSDADFICDAEPLGHCKSSTKPQNWTASHAHLMAQLDAARDPALTWMTYQEGYDPKKSGACPIRNGGNYGTKHNPFVYFADVSGAPPSPDNEYCAAHTRALDHFAGDMKSNDLANYVFITPDSCHNMHGGSRCRDNKIATGDDFLKNFLPPLLSWAEENVAIVFVTWDEGSRGKSLPFFAAGAGVRAGHESTVEYTHASVLRTVERIFGLPLLDAVKGSTDLADMFEPGVLP